MDAIIKQINEIRAKVDSMESISYDVQSELLTQLGDLEYQFSQEVVKFTTSNSELISSINKKTNTNKK